MKQEKPPLDFQGFGGRVQWICWATIAPKIFAVQNSGARGPPQFLKKRSENAGANENLSGGFAAIPGIAPRVAPRIVGFVLIKS